MSNKTTYLSIRHYWFERTLYRIKTVFFKSDVTIFMISFIVFSIGLVIYVVLFLISDSLPKIAFFFEKWRFSVFFPFWISCVALFLTVLVSFKLSLRKAENAKDFLELLTGELGLAKNTEPFIIIIPNLNLAQYNFPTEFQKFKSIINRAINRNMKLEFIIPSIDKSYINSYDYFGTITYKSNFFDLGKQNNSLSLKYIYDRYSDKLNAEQYNETIAFFKELINHDNVQIYNCNEKFVDSHIVGFISYKSAFIGKYYDYEARNGRVVLEGEMIDTKETVHLLNEYFIPNIIKSFTE